MTKNFLAIAGVLIVVALVTMVGVSVMATGDETGQERGGFMRHFHMMGQSLHGGGGHHRAMAELIEQLELTPDQQGHLDRIHELMGGCCQDGSGSMSDLHERLIDQFRSGRLETDEIHGMVDRHVEQMRTTAYAVTDELVTLINGLDASQRETLLAHFEEVRHEGHAHGHGHGGH